MIGANSHDLATLVGHFIDDCNISFSKIALTMGITNEEVINLYKRHIRQQEDLVSREVGCSQKIPKVNKSLGISD